MTSPDAAESVLLEAFDEVALLLSGTAAARRWEGGLVWSLLRRLARLRERALARLARNAGPNGEEAPGGPAQAHPAVEEFLRRRPHRAR
jgi:hypothetical protein